MHPARPPQRIIAAPASRAFDDPQVTIAKTYGLFAGDDGASLPEYFPDRVHPNAAGYAKWVGTLRPIFAKLGLGDGPSKFDSSAR